jgi:hypothetical protein
LKFFDVVFFTHFNHFYYFVTQAKAFDKKTSVLVYLVKLIKKNDPGLLEVKDYVTSVQEAEKVMLDVLSGDLKQLGKEIKMVKESSKKAGDKHRGEDGKLINPQIKKTLHELREQKTMVRQVSGVKFYNQMEHDIEHTPMEMFVLEAEQLVNRALEKIGETQNSFVAVLHYFGEDEKMTTPDFFGTLRKFFIAFEAAKDHCEKQDLIRVSQSSVLQLMTLSLRPNSLTFHYYLTRNEN